MSRPLRYSLVVSAILILSGAVFLAYYVPTLAPRLKRRVVLALEQRFDADVHLKALTFSLFPAPGVDGEGLTIDQKNEQPNSAPFLAIRHFHAQAGVATIFDWRNLVDKVVLDGLEIHIPRPGENHLKAKSRVPGTNQLPFVIRTIVADNALLEIEPKPGKDALSFPIESLTMHSVGPGQAMAFHARVRNAKPPGAIDTTGHFGPWQRDDPRQTPLSGDYAFAVADLSVFNGISGILASSGQFQGVLQRIQVAGTADVPQFSLKKGGAPVHLVTNFHSVVDGTNGDTMLDPVDAKFGHSEFVCRGGVVHHAGDAGKTVELQASSRYARLEDILTLVVGGPPVMAGKTDFQSKIVIPPGRQAIAEKLNLDGQFRLTSAVFTSPKAAERLRLLSHRASGITKNDENHDQAAAGGNVASNLFARFRLQRGDLSLAALSFEVPGARIQLGGHLNLVTSAVALKGRFQMNAKLSQTQSGLKSIVLKPFDRLFEKDGAGFELPLSISGTREHPVIGVEAFHKRFSIH